MNEIATTVVEATCPICGGREFKNWRKRPSIRCTSCGSVPRTRSTWLLLTLLARIGPGSRIAHFAPEKNLSGRLREIAGAGYEAYDLDPGQWATDEVRVEPFDLCSDLHRLSDGDYDVVLHNHVIEHLPCNETIVLQRLHAKLKPGGWHIFSFPIKPGDTYRSDLSSEMSDEDRVRLFGQSDHLRQVGTTDFGRTIGMVFDIPDTWDLTDLLGEEVLSRANVIKRQRVIGGGTVFAIQKTG